VANIKPSSRRITFCDYDVVKIVLYLRSHSVTCDSRPLKMIGHGAKT
jgi:hypothetical protein